MIPDSLKEQWKEQDEQRAMEIDKLQTLDYSCVAAWHRYNNDNKKNIFTNINQFEKMWDERRME